MMRATEAFVGWLEEQAAVEKLMKVGGATVKGSGKMVKMKQSSERADGEAVSSDGLSVTSSGVKEVVKETVKVIQEIPLRVLVCSGGMTPGIQAGDDQIRQNWKSHVAWMSGCTPMPRSSFFSSAVAVFGAVYAFGLDNVKRTTTLARQSCDGEEPRPKPTP